MKSYLIRNTIELCERTIFVIPPLSCYRPRVWKNNLDIRDYYAQVIKRHAREVGLHFPDARIDAGLFLVMDPKTGQPIKRLEWQQHRFVRVHKSRSGIVKSQSVETTPVLDATRIKAAIAMVA